MVPGNNELSEDSTKIHPGKLSSKLDPAQLLHILSHDAKGHLTNITTRNALKRHGQVDSELKENEVQLVEILQDVSEPFSEAKKTYSSLILDKEDQIEELSPPKVSRGTEKKPDPLKLTGALSNFDGRSSDLGDVPNHRGDILGYAWLEREAKWPNVEFTERINAIMDPIEDPKQRYNAKMSRNLFVGIQDYMDIARKAEEMAFKGEDTEFSNFYDEVDDVTVDEYLEPFEEWCEIEASERESQGTKMDLEVRKNGHGDTKLPYGMSQFPVLATDFHNYQEMCRQSEHDDQKYVIEVHNTSDLTELEYVDEVVADEWNGVSEESSAEEALETVAEENPAEEYTVITMRDDGEGLENPQEYREEGSSNGGFGGQMTRKMVKMAEGSSYLIESQLDGDPAGKGVMMVLPYHES